MLPENHPHLSIVIPAFNEEMRLPATLQTLAHFFVGRSAEILIVVEKSTDATLAVAESFAKLHPQFVVLANDVQRGKGYAVKRGMLAARGELVFFMDADLSVPLPAVEMFVAEFQAQPEVDILVGNRQHAESDIVKDQGWLRRSMGQTFNHLVRLMSRIPLRDTQCGFKAFRREVARDLFSAQTIDGFAFDVEILLLAKRRRYKMADLPVEWHNSIASKVHIVHDSLQMLWDIWRLK
ncbi:MAG TPA: dolichyl-phosphate beta-glucosyltransferase [Chthoniobacterales bacterium]|jgi:glycosyltransferase involved in cell wall biosynthesis